MPTIKQRKAFKEVGENGGNISKAMETVGYAPSVTHATEKLTNSKGWQELMEQHLPDKDLAKMHRSLLISSRMDHMVFPLGPKDEDDINFSGAKVVKGEEEIELDEAEVPEQYKERTTLIDKEIIEMLAEVNCKVRRIVHGNTARHVYFWSADNKARQAGLEMAYKLKGRFQKEGGTSLVAVQVNVGDDRSKFR